jgi:two-component system sensor histidine kinase RegB
MALTSAPAAARAERPDGRRSDTPPPAPPQAGPLGLTRPGGQSARLRARTLIILRWLAIAGQTAAVLVTGLVLKYPIPYLPCFALIGLAAWLNIALSLSPAAKRVAKPWEATGQLAFDIAELAGLLYATGGINNPFCLLLIAPVTLAAATLPLRNALGLGLLAVAATVALTIHALPMPWAVGSALELPLIFRVAMALA